MTRAQNFRKQKKDSKFSIKIKILFELLQNASLNRIACQKVASNGLVVSIFNNKKQNKINTNFPNKKIRFFDKFITNKFIFLKNCERLLSVCDGF